MKVISLYKGENLVCHYIAANDFNTRGSDGKMMDFLCDNGYTLVSQECPRIRSFKEFSRVVRSNVKEDMEDTGYGDEFSDM